MRKVLALLFVLLGAAPASAQITITYTFVAGTTADPDQVNTNFTALGTNALNRTGGTMTGNITMAALATVDGVDVGVQACTACTPTFAAAVLTGGLTAGSGTVGVIDATGKIPAISSTYFASLSGANLTTLNATNLSSGLLPAARLDDVVISRPELLNFKETKATGTISTNTLAVDLANGNHFAVALNAAITTFTIANVPASGKAAAVTFIFTADGTIRAVTWPVGTIWSDGVAPTMTGTNAKVDIVTLYTVNNGTTWYGVVGGQNF